MGLLAMYSAGLAVPFLLSTVLLERFLSGFKRIRAWMPWINRTSGVLMLGLGVLMLTGQFTWLSAQLARWTPAWLSGRL